jgi:hypothetical protein
MTDAELEELRGVMVPLLHRSDALVRELYEVLGSWPRVEAWFVEAVAGAEQKELEALDLDGLQEVINEGAEAEAYVRVFVHGAANDD